MFQHHLVAISGSSFLPFLSMVNHLESVMGNLIRMYAEIMVVCLAQSSNNYIISA